MREPVVPYQELTLPKKEQVTLMFDRIAFRYDLMNHMLSFGIDKLWRKKMVRILHRSRPENILDVATGTADVAIRLATLHPKKITGIDISREMLAIGKQKIKEKNLDAVISLQEADCENLPFADNNFDAVTVAFGVRNFEHLEKGLSEISRVLKKDGKLVVLEFSRPLRFPFKQLFHFYFSRICPLIGKWITKDQLAYEYLHRSVAGFPDGKDFLSILDKTGFTKNKCIPLLFGISSLYTGSKR